MFFSPFAVLHNMPKGPEDIEFIESVIARIKALRLEKGITHEVFFHDTGIHIGRIESQKVDIRISTLRQIAAYFEVEVEVLVGQEVE